MNNFDLCIFPVLLECAYGLDILFVEKTNRISSIHGIQILTNDGSLAIEIIVSVKNARRMKVNIQSELRNISREDIYTLCDEQLKTFKFLYIEDDVEMDLQWI